MEELTKVLGLKSNVMITKRNVKTGKETVTHIHNIATKKMVEGIIYFLRGAFNVSTSQTNVAAVDSTGAAKYIPTYVGFGVGGYEYVLEKGWDLNNLQPDQLLEYRNLYGGYYDDTSLKDEVYHQKSGAPKDLLRMEIGRSTIGNYSSFYSDSLILSCYVEKGFYVGKLSNNAFKGSTNTPITLTEIGLFSGPDKDSQLLARVCLDPEDWIVQGPNEVITVNWTITVTAITDK